MKKNRWKDRYKDNDNYKGKSNYNAQPKHDGSYFDFLIGKMVTIYRGGPESRSGKLLDVQCRLYDSLHYQTRLSFIINPNM